MKLCVYLVLVSATVLLTVSGAIVSRHEAERSQRKHLDHDESTIVRQHEDRDLYRTTQEEDKEEDRFIHGTEHKRFTKRHLAETPQISESQFQDSSNNPSESQDRFASQSEKRDRLGAYDLQGLSAGDENKPASTPHSADRSTLHTRTPQHSDAHSVHDKPSVPVVHSLVSRITRRKRLRFRNAAGRRIARLLGGGVVKGAIVLPPVESSRSNSSLTSSSKAEDGSSISQLKHHDSMRDAVSETVPLTPNQNGAQGEYQRDVLQGQQAELSRMKTVQLQVQSDQAREKEVGTGPDVQLDEKEDDKDRQPNSSGQARNNGKITVSIDADVRAGTRSRTSESQEMTDDGTSYDLRDVADDSVPQYESQHYTSNRAYRSPTSSWSRSQRLHHDPTAEALAVLTQKLSRMEEEMGRLKEAVLLQGAVHIKTSERIEGMLLAQGKLAVKDEQMTRRIWKKLKRCCHCASSENRSTTSEATHSEKGHKHRKQSQKGHSNRAKPESKDEDVRTHTGGRHNEDDMTLRGRNGQRPGYPPSNIASVASREQSQQRTSSNVLTTVPAVTPTPTKAPPVKAKPSTTKAAITTTTPSIQTITPTDYAAARRKADDHTRWTPTSNSNNTHDLDSTNIDDSSNSIDIDSNDLSSSDINSNDISSNDTDDDSNTDIVYAQKLDNLGKDDTNNRDMNNKGTELHDAKDARKLSDEKQADTSLPSNNNITEVDGEPSALRQSPHKRVHQSDKHSQLSQSSETATKENLDPEPSTPNTQYSLPGKGEGEVTTPVQVQDAQKTAEDAQITVLDAQITLAPGGSAVSDEQTTTTTSQPRIDTDIHYAHSAKINKDAHAADETDAQITDRASVDSGINQTPAPPVNKSSKAVTQTDAGGNVNTTGANTDFGLSSAQSVRLTEGLETSSSEGKRLREQNLETPSSRSNGLLGDDGDSLLPAVKTSGELGRDILLPNSTNIHSNEYNNDNKIGPSIQFNISNDYNNDNKIGPSIQFNISNNDNKIGLSIEFNVSNSYNNEDETPTDNIDGESVISTVDSSLLSSATAPNKASLSAKGVSSTTTTTPTSTTTFTTTEAIPEQLLSVDLRTGAIEENSMPGVEWVVLPRPRTTQQRHHYAYISRGRPRRSAHQRLKTPPRSTHQGLKKPPAKHDEIYRPSSTRQKQHPRHVSHRRARRSRAQAAASHEGDAECSVQGVIKFTFSKPPHVHEKKDHRRPQENRHRGRHLGSMTKSDVGDDSITQQEGRRKLQLEMVFRNPRRWVFNLGDSIANNGFSGDGSVQENDCEVQGYGRSFAFYGSDKHTNGREKMLKLFNNFIFDNVTLVVSDESLEWTNHRGISGSLNDASLFALSGQSDSQGAVNYDVYLGLNRVVDGNYRQGQGLCRLTARWLPAD